MTSSSRLPSIAFAALLPLLAAGCVEGRVPMPEPRDAPEREHAPPPLSPLARPVPIANLGDGLSLAEARELARAGNLSIAAIRYRIQVAAAERTESRIYPHNPEVAASGASDAPFENEGERSFSVGLSQQFEIGGQSRWRRRLADARHAAALSEVADAERRLLEEVTAAFVDFRLFTELAALKSESLELAERSVRMAQAREDAGGVPKLETNMARRALLRARQELRAAEAERVEAVLRLSTLTGRELPEDLRPQEGAAEEPAPIPVRDSLLALAMDRRPDLLRAVQKARAAQAGLELSETYRTPNVTVGIGVEQERLELKRPIRLSESDESLTVSLSLPIPAWNRNQGPVERARAELAEAEAEVRALRAEISGEVARALARHDRALAEVDALERDTLPLVKESLELTQKAYETGQVGTRELLLALTDHNETLQARQEALARLRWARARLEAAVGGPLEEARR